MKKFNRFLSCVLVLAMLLTFAPASLAVSAAPKNAVKTSITKIEPKAKGFKVSWKKKSKIKGYQIQYSTSSKFKKSASKTKLVTKAKTKSATISKLNGCNKKYYVRLRTYKVSSGKKIYSSWSKSKKVTTKNHNYISGACSYCGDETKAIATPTYEVASGLTEAQIRAIIQEEIRKANQSQTTPSIDISAITNAVIDAVNKQNEFIPGEKLYNPMGNNVRSLIRCTPYSSSYYDNKFAVITKLEVTKKKIADLMNIDEYKEEDDNYYRYLYDVTIEGRVDAEFAGEYMEVYLSYEGSSSPRYYYPTTVNSDGTFVINYTQHLDINASTVYPAGIAIGDVDW